MPVKVARRSRSGEQLVNGFDALAVPLVESPLNERPLFRGDIARLLTRTTAEQIESARVRIAGQEETQRDTGHDELERINREVIDPA